MTDALIHQETHDPAGEGGPAAEDVYVFPLSFAQQRLWFFQQMYPGSSTYNMPVAMRLKGRLDVEHLRAALCEVARRHEVLRTSIDLMGDRPAQLISEEAEIALPVLDLSAVPDDERDAEARRLATEEVTRAFDLRRGPLLRARVLRLSPEEHVLLIVIHHIISDGWSIGVLMNEVVELYDAYTTGREPALPELPIQYADYAVWQREWLTGDVLEEQLAYWRGQLGGAPPVLTLPTDRPRPQVQTLAGAHFEFALPEGLPAGLRQLCRDEGVTMFMLLLAAFQALLSRYSGQTDVTVGTPIAGRNRAEVEGLIGFFANTLVLRADLSGEPTFRELLRRVKKTCLGAYAHQEMPLERMVEELQPERSLSHAPLFQVLFALQNTPAESFNMPGLEMSPAELDLTTTAFDLTLNVEEFGEDIYCRLRYNTDLFEPETVRRMAGHYVTLLGAAAEDAERPVAELPLLSEAERRRALEEWSGGRREPAPDAHVHVLFERQAARTPDGAALVFEGRQLGYAELNRRADQLARHLSGLGVGPESAVAVCVRRSFEMFVGILGVLKAGGAYVPLDPAAPPERVRFVLEDTSASVLLTQRGLAASLPTTRARVICLDENYSAGEDDAPADGVGGLAPPALAPDNLAYVIYTSGSTGRPKGVMVSHASLANTIHARFAQIGETPAGTLLQMSYVFDGSLLSIFCALTQGGVLVIPREGQQSDPAVAAELIAAGRLPHLYTVPSFYSLLLEQARPGQLDSLRVVTVGAEVCTPQLVGEHRRVLPRARLFNEYGPTEATVYCAAHECGAEDAARASVPVGRPTCNMRLYVLDRHLQPVPVGVSGGLYVGGPGLARGYLNRAGLTAESFIPNPFSAEPGTRLYRTGDLARHDADGRIVFLGRLDSQVKIRGYRIELEEIEAALGECRAVRQAAAAVREDAPGDARLVAYLVADDAHAPTAEDLREHLRARLPDYMVPSAFVFVEELPRTAAGKVDRRALPSAGGARPRLAGAYVEPRTALERLLAETWRDVLGAEQVGVNDNFFDLGGDSLRAAILVNKLQQRLGDFVYVVALFEAPTVAALAAYLTEHYSAAVSRVVGVEDGGAGLVAGADEGSSRAVNAESLARVREVIGVATPAPETNAAKNSPAVFVLSPPRSGSTLLRVMLAGHPSLFAPPELELLSFNTLAERREALSGKYSFWLEGTVRALMEIKGCGMEEARRLMEECEERNFSVPQFYGLMQEWIGGRMLVDKTPSYALDREVLRRAENHFDGARYVHLLRHPYGMIRSFEEAKLEQVFFRYRHSFSRRELAELIWLVSQQNIAEFLSSVPAGRQHRLRFEELVSSPREVLEGLCDFLGVEFHPAMVEPYRHQERRMTDGIHPLSQMLGDVKFHQHSRIDAAVAERWRGQTAGDPLAEMTWDAAEALGYQREHTHGRRPTQTGPAESTAVESTAKSPLLVAVQPQGHLPPFFCVHPVGGSPFCYLDLSRRLGPEQPFYGLRAPDLVRGAETRVDVKTDVETMAAAYVEAVRAVQPSGPYRLGGWSLGGVVAFEMARQLQARGETVAALVMFDSYAPELLGDEFHPRADGATPEGDDAGDPLASEGVLDALDELCRTGTDEEIKDAFETATRVGLLPPEVGPREFTRWLRGCRSRIAAARAYVPERFAGRVSLFRPSERHAGGEENLDPALGWGGLASEGVEVYSVPGTHLGMIQEPHVSSLASRLKRILA